MISLISLLGLREPSYVGIAVWCLPAEVFLLLSQHWIRVMNRNGLMLAFRRFGLFPIVEDCLILKTETGIIEVLPGAVKGQFAWWNNNRAIEVPLRAASGMAAVPIGCGF